MYSHFTPMFDIEFNYLRLVLLIYSNSQKIFTRMYNLPYLAVIVEKKRL